MLKVDLNKAYDRITWRFLLKVMEVMGFPPCWLAWVRACNSFITFSVLVNRVPTTRCKSHAGLR